MMKNIGLTAAEKFWYVLGCIAFGAAYFKKVPVAKASASWSSSRSRSMKSFRLWPDCRLSRPERGTVATDSEN